MNIAIYGCSWSAGVSETKDNWVKHLCELFPHHNFYNYSKSGISMSAILYLFEKNHTKYDYNIVQCTSPARFTSFANNVDFNLTKKDKKNYYTWKQNVQNKILTINAGSSGSKSLESPWTTYNAKKLHKFLYMHADYKIAEVENFAICEYLKSKANFVFKHRNKQKLNCPSVEDYVSFNNKNILDDGYHFTVSGNRLQADWIKKYLDLT